MKARQFIFRRFQLHRRRRRVGRQIADVSPIENFDDARAAEKSLRHQTADETLQADVRAADAPDSSGFNELNIVDAHDALAVNVDQLIIQNVFVEQNFAFAARKGR